MAKEKVDLLEALRQSTLEDLEKVRAEIGQMQKSMDGLRVLERAIDVQLHGDKRRATCAANAAAGRASRAAKKAAATVTGNGVPNVAEAGPLADTRKRVARYLRANGPRLKAKLAEANGISLVGRNCMAVVIGCDWFHVNNDDVVSLTSAGEKAALTL